MRRSSSRRCAFYRQAVKGVCRDPEAGYSGGGRFESGNVKLGVDTKQPLFINMKFQLQGRIETWSDQASSNWVKLPVHVPSLLCTP